MLRVLHFMLYLEHQCPVLAIFRMEPMEDHGQGRFRVYVYLVALTVRGWPAATDGLDGDLARLQ